MKAYGPVMGIATAIIAIGIAVTVALGPERIGRRFDLAPIAGEGQMTPVKDLESAGDEKLERRETSEHSESTERTEKLER